MIRMSEVLWGLCEGGKWPKCWFFSLYWLLFTPNLLAAFSQEHAPEKVRSLKFVCEPVSEILLMICQKEATSVIHWFPQILLTKRLLLECKLLHHSCWKVSLWLSNFYSTFLIFFFFLKNIDDRIFLPSTTIFSILIEICSHDKSLNVDKTWCYPVLTQSA